MLNYNSNHWAVVSKYTDTLSTAKNLPLPDLSYDTDFRKSSDEPNEAVISNTTGSEILSPESIRYGATMVKNIYNGTNVTVSEMAPYKGGVQTLVEIKETYSATHDTTGSQIQLPCTARIVLKFPTHNSVSKDLVQDLLSRVVAAALNTGAVDAERQIELARGTLIPDGL